VCVFITALLPLKHNQRTLRSQVGRPMADVAQTIAPIIWESRRKWVKWSHTGANQTAVQCTVYQRTFVARDTNNLRGVTEILCAFDCFILAKVKGISATHMIASHRHGIPLYLVKRL
jgi:hypothetical protein